MLDVKDRARPEHTRASWMMVSSLFCSVSPELDQLVEPETRQRSSTMTIFRCMTVIAPPSEWPMAELAIKSLKRPHRLVCPPF